MSTYQSPFGPAPFTTLEARAVGWTKGRLRAHVRNGHVRRVLHGVYVDAGVADTLSLRAAAVAKVTPPGQVVCLRTAAWLFSVDALPVGAHRDLPPIDLMSPSGTAAPRRSGCAGRTGPLPRSDLVALSGTLVTTPARTAADLLRLLRRPDALAAIDAMMRDAPVSREAVADVLLRFARSRGVMQARELLALADARSESPQESRTRLRIVDAGFPCPEPQIKVYDGAGELLARLDMGYRELRKAVEFDGDEAHGTAALLRHDRRRRERVERRGWGLLVVTSEHVFGKGLAFERAMAELLEREPRLTKNHPRYGGWDRRVPGGL